MWNMFSITDLHIGLMGIPFSRRILQLRARTLLECRCMGATCSSLVVPHTNGALYALLDYEFDVLFAYTLHVEWYTSTGDRLHR